MNPERSSPPSLVKPRMCLHRWALQADNIAFLKNVSITGGIVAVDLNHGCKECKAKIIATIRGCDELTMDTF